MNTEPFNGVVAGVAITSPWWIHALEAVSNTSVIILPIFGVIWLIVQITFTIKSGIRGAARDIRQDNRDTRQDTRDEKQEIKSDKLYVKQIIQDIKDEHSS